MPSIAGPLLGVVAGLSAAACGGSGQASVSPGFATMAGVLGCADSVVWGRITGAEPVAGRLAVTVDVDEWLVPSTGGPTLSVQADDPAREVGAPAWEPGRRVLVVVPERDPAAAYSAADGERAVEAWRDEGYRRPSDEECGRS